MTDQAHPRRFEYPMGAPEASHEHTWRCFPITTLDAGYRPMVDVICIECGETQSWPTSCITEGDVPLFNHETDWTHDKAYAHAGDWTTDAHSCGFTATARTAKRAISAVIQHREKFHNG